MRFIDDGCANERDVGYRDMDVPGSFPVYIHQPSTKYPARFPFHYVI